MFKNLRLKYRILLGYSVPLLLSVVVAIVVYNCVMTVRYKEAEVDRANTIIHDMLELELSFTRTVNSTRGILLLQDEVSRANHRKAVKGVRDKIDLAKNLVKDSRNKETLVKLDNIQQKLIKVENEVISFVNEGKLDKGLELFKTQVSSNLFNESILIIDDFLGNQFEKIQIRKKASLQASDTLLKVLIGGTLLMVILAVAIGLWIAARTSKDIDEAATNISTSATEIAATVSQHERAASEQFAMVNETTATVDELNASARQSAEQASSSVEAAQRTSALTEEGNQAVVQAIEGINSLKDKMGVVADQILRLGQQTSQIDNIAGLVKDLATQTNMLALNAAVEAARAGEHGKGFAVVASEVRKLADLSKKSAEEASIIIADIQKATNATIMETEESTKTMAKVTKSAHRVEELFETLAGEAGRVYENAQQVVLNVKQQCTALSQIGEAMNNINASSKETATGISQTKIGIQNLENAAQNLQAMV